MDNNSRDERLIALEAVAKTAESKLKSAETSAEKIGQKLRSSEDSFMQRLSDKSESYKKQTGAELVRNVDEATGKVTYDFVREATKQEKKKRRKYVISRNFNENSGKAEFKREFVLDENDRTLTVTSAKDLKKPKERKKYIAVKVFGHYGKIEFSTNVNNPFLNTVGKPVIVPVQAAAKLTEKIGNAAESLGHSKAAKVISSPIVIPAKVVRNIADKGGVIHAVVDLGDRIRIDGNIPKPVKVSGDIVKGTALGIETGAVETAKGLKNFSLEIAKEKIAEEINKGVSENQATEAVYVIGTSMLDVYRILDEHSKFRRAVIRDKAGGDITDPEISLYLAQKEERQFQNAQDKLKEQKAVADFNAQKAKAAYEAAKKRLENHQTSVSSMHESAKDVSSSDKKADTEIKKAPDSKLSGNSKIPDKSKTSVTNDSISKIDKKIEKKKRKIKLNQQHKYKVKFKQKAVVGKDGNAKLALKPVVVREEIIGKTPATAWNTAKKLDGYAVNKGIQSMRRKAMRDGGDNSAVQAADFAITAAQSANRAVKYIDGKERAYKEKVLKKELTKLENQKKIESALKESPNQKARPKSKPDKKAVKKQNKANQNKLLQKKRQQKLVHSNLAEKTKKAAKDLIKEAAGYAVKRSGSLVAIIIFGLLVPIMFPVIGFSSSGVTGGMGNFVGNAVSSCDTNDLSRCNEYYTELAKNLIEQHKNIRNYYTGYDTYTCLTKIDKLDHSPQKLLPFLAVSAMRVSGDDSWNFENAKPFIKNVFDELYEFYANEVREQRIHVTQKSDTQASSEYVLGGSIYTLNGVTYDSEDYAGYAHTYTPVIVSVASGYETSTLDRVGKYTEKNGYTNEYDEAQTITFNNVWELKLIFEWNGSEYIEHWQYYEEYQEYYEYDYVTLEYAIREKDISVDGSYWTDTDSDWQDSNFDKIIYNHYCDMSDEEKEMFDNYYVFFMGHQVFDMPFENAEISKYAGYNTEVNGDMSLDKSFELKTYSGQEIICGMDGEITVINGGFYIYNAKYGTIYYDGAAAPAVSSAKQGEVISSSTGDVLRITYIDNEGNYINPLFVFS